MERVTAVRERSILPANRERRKLQMRYSILILSILFSSVSLTAGVHAEPQEPKRHYVVPPAENILLVVASQPGSPVEFRNARLILSTVDSKWGVTGQVRNRSAKPIRSFTATIWSSLGTGGTLVGSEWSSGKVMDRLMQPGQIVEQDCDGEIVLLTDDLRDKLSLRGPMKAVAVLMIERVVFEDGAIYSDESTSKALRDYFTKMAEN
jgi:hypothetical protein